MDKEKVTVSFRVDRRIHEQMRLCDDVNWSAAMRKSLERLVEERRPLDRERISAARRGMDELRKAGAFAGGKPAVEVIREWRDKRR